MKRNIKMLLIVSVAALLLAGVMVFLLLLPSEDENAENEATANITLSVDDSKIHQAQVKTDSDGNIEQNGSGTLLNYSTGEVLQIHIENENAGFDVKGTVSESEDGEKTAENHTLVGYDDFSLQSDTLSAIITDASALTFQKIVSLDKEKAADFGFDSPVSTVTVTYTDGTKAIIYVGGDAPQGAGTYIKFGGSDAVYLVSADAVDTYLYTELNFIDLTVTEAATDGDEEVEVKAQTIELSGTNFEKTIKLQENKNDNNSAAYQLSEGEYANESETESISGAIRGLTATEVKAVNPDEKTLTDLGLSKPYARLKAVYSDVTVELIASEPDSDGNVNLMNVGGKVVYSMGGASLPWVTASTESLRSEYVLHPETEKISGLFVDNGTAYDFSVNAENVTTTDDEGNESTTLEITASYQDSEVDSSSFTTFLNNLTQLKLKAVSDEKPSDELLLTVKYTYEDGSSDDVKFYAASGGRCLATVNGKTAGYVYKSNITKLTSQVENVLNGSTVEEIN